MSATALPVRMPVYGWFAFLRSSARFFAAASHVDTDVIAFIHVQARSGFLAPFGIAHALPVS